tara:strand:+ start:13971 stop:14390 length:420 start_codon:yes stop_codon:yes gene_type:complete
MYKFSIERTVNADLERTFNIMTNFENFQKLFPQFYPSILIKSVRDESSLVAEHLRLGDKEFIIMAKHFLNKPNSHEMRIVGGDIKGSKILEVFTTIDEKTNLEISVELDVKSSRFSKKNIYEESLNELYDLMIEEIEKS